MTRQSGFTLLELMIVVALIVIIAAITIPSVTEAKIHATEASALASVRAISVAEVAYASTYGGYAPSLANLGGGGTLHHICRNSVPDRSKPGRRDQVGISLHSDRRRSVRWSQH